MWMRLATGHKRMQPTNPLLWRHQATGDPSKDLQQGVPAAKRFCLWFQVSWSFFCFVWLILQLMFIPTGWVFIQGKWTSPEVECINCNPGRMRHFILLGYAAYIRVFLFFFPCLCFQTNGATWRGGSNTCCKCLEPRLEIPSRKFLSDHQVAKRCGHRCGNHFNRTRQLAVASKLIVG